MASQENSRAPAPRDVGTDRGGYDDAPVPYMERTRTYYRALGFETPYRWAHFEDVPFTPLPMSLAACRVALVTTAAPFEADRGDQGPGAPYNAAAKFYRVYSLPADPMPDVRISHVAIDRDHTTAEDPGTWFPLPELARLAAAGRISAVTRHVHGLPTNRSQRTTVSRDAPELLERLRADGAQVAVLAANCPVCHQCIALAARHLEAAGIATVVMGCARDIVEHCGVPRFLFSDFPLGNAAGRPNDAESQRRTLAMALELLETAAGPRTTRRSPIRWSDDSGWKLDYANIERLDEEEIARRRRRFLEQKAVAKQRRDG